MHIHCIFFGCPFYRKTHKRGDNCVILKGREVICVIEGEASGVKQTVIVKGIGLTTYWGRSWRWLPSLSGGERERER